MLGPPVLAGDDTISHEDAAETRRVRSVQMRGLQEAALAGAYGPMLQRNQIAIDGFGAEFGAYFTLNQLFPRVWYKSESAESPLMFSFAKADAEGLVNDLHQYARQVCP